VERFQRKKKQKKDEPLSCPSQRREICLGARFFGSFGFGAMDVRLVGVGLARLPDDAVRPGAQTVVLDVAVSSGALAV
jgi:hypothetical protein